jgi:hypothetical protein
VIGEAKDLAAAELCTSTGIYDQNAKSQHLIEMLDFAEKTNWRRFALEQLIKQFIKEQTTNGLPTVFACSVHF